MTSVALKKLIQRMPVSFNFLYNHRQLQDFLKQASTGIHVSILHNSALLPNHPSFKSGHFFTVMMDKKSSDEIHMSSFDSLGYYSSIYSYITHESHSLDRLHDKLEYVSLTYDDSPLTIQLRLPPELVRQNNEPICYAYALQDAYILSQLTHLSLDEARKEFYEKLPSIRMDELTLAKRMYEALFIMNSEDNALHECFITEKSHRSKTLTLANITALDVDQTIVTQAEHEQTNLASSLMKYGLFCSVVTTVATIGYYSSAYITAHMSVRHE